jgi:hypothetical protein
VKTAIAIAIALALSSLTGCAARLGQLARSDAEYRLYSDVKVPVIPPTGGLYTDIHAPLLGEAGSSFGAKKGTATTHRIGLPPGLGLLVGAPIPAVGLFSWGDGSAQHAAANGGITQVKHADYRYRIILFVYQTYTTEVYGD